MTYQRDKRFYPYFSPRDGRYKNHVVVYTLWFNDNGTLIDVRNEYHFSVEKESEVWEYYSSKVNGG